MDNDTSAIRVIEELGLETGLMWDKISEFSKRLSSFEESVSHKVGESQSEKLKERLDHCAELIKSFVMAGVKNTMNTYNNT